MKTAEELGTRILRISQMMEDGLMQAALDFRRADRDPDTLWSGIEALAPSITALNDRLRDVLQKHDISDALINHIRAVECTSAYAIGILAGLHLAARTDLVPKLAHLYAHTTNEGEMLNYDDDGESIPPAKT